MSLPRAPCRVDVKGLAAMAPTGRLNVNLWEVGFHE